MKTITITILGILLIGIAVAGGVLTTVSFEKTNEIDKTTRDYLLTKVAEVDSTKGEVKQIKPIIDLRCFDKECFWNAYQENIIQSYDNQITREYCKTKDEENILCIEQGIRTLEEMNQIVSDIVYSKIGDFAISDQIKQEPKEISEGTLEIREK